MDEFVRCPQCDDDLLGEDWEQHLSTHGYFKAADAPEGPWEELKADRDRLRAALIEHRADLHRGSNRRASYRTAAFLRYSDKSTLVV